MTPFFRTTLRTSLAATAILGALTLAGCSGSSATPGTGASDGASSSTTSTAPFNDADVTFTQMMIPHHQQAVQMSDMLLAKQGVDSDVASLARKIKAEQQPEITTMQGWLSTWGRPGAGGMDMGTGGEMSPSQMEALRKADGSTGQRLYLQGMVEHHRGAIQMAKDEVAAGQDPGAIALARSIISSQQEEITTMHAILAGL